QQQSSLLRYYGERAAEDPSTPGCSSECGDSVPSPPPNVEGQANSMESILRDIHQTNSHIEEKINKINSSISSMDKKMEVFTKRLDEAEHRLGNTEDSVHGMETSVQQLQETVVKLQEKTDDLENRSRRCNLRLVGLPEGEEGKDPVSFLETWFPSLLNLPDLSNNLKVERAHHAFLPRIRNTDRPRMLIFKLLRYRDKEVILRQARKLGTLTFKNKPVYIFPDMSADLFQKRKSFFGVKRLCKDLDIPFALLFPARLQIDFQGQCLFFTNPLDAENHIKMASLPDDSPPSPREQRLRP
uniref:L1 transposable element RRM domain-containing protein n=1 Tax=Latimeria chalumnae TaxID=7897 RepID=H2ZZE1_LATCH